MVGLLFLKCGATGNLDFNLPLLGLLTNLASEHTLKYPIGR